MVLAEASVLREQYAKRTNLPIASVDSPYFYGPLIFYELSS